MQKQFFFLSPVEVVKVSSKNLDEVAEWCGGKVAETASRRVPGRMDKYVWVPTPKGNGIAWAFPGMFVTKRLVIGDKGELKTTWAVFRRDYFETNYFNTPAEAVEKTWERDARQNGGHRPEVQEPAPAINVNIYQQSGVDSAQEVAEQVKVAIKSIAGAKVEE